MDIQFEKLKKKFSDRPTHTCKTGSGKGNQTIFKMGLTLWLVIWVVPSISPQPLINTQLLKKNRVYVTCYAEFKK